MKKYLVVMLTIAMLTLLLMAGCKKKLEVMEKVDPTDPRNPTVTEQPPVIETPVEVPPVVETKEVPTTPVACTLNSECAGGSFCIEKTCTDLKSLVNTSCDKLCTIKEVVIETNDGKTYTLPPGKGDYTAAGAIDWTIQRLPPHCPATNLKIPITVLKKNYDKVLGDDALLLGKGEKSPVITHPINKRVAFTMTVKDIVEMC